METPHKVITLDNLALYDERIKEYISEQIQSSSIAEGLLLETFQHTDDFDITFGNDYHPTDLLDLISNANCTGTWDKLIDHKTTTLTARALNCKELYMDNVTAIPTVSTAFSAGNLIKASFPNLEGQPASGTTGWLNATALQALSIPKVASLRGRFFTNNRALLYLDIRSVTDFVDSYLNVPVNLKHLHINKETTNSTLSGSNVSLSAKSWLYDIRLHSDVNVNYNISAWSPTIAVSNTDTTLTERDEWDDHPANITFANNREKFLWYFRNRFKACFEDKTGSTQTLTLKSTIYDILETSDFTDWAAIGWSIARVA